MIRYLLFAALLLGLRSPATAQLLWQQVMGTATMEETSSAFVAVPGGFLNVGQGGATASAPRCPIKSTSPK